MHTEYPEELRLQIIEEYKAGGTNIMALARKYEPSEASIGKWIKAAGIKAVNPRCYSPSLVRRGFALRDGGHSVPQIVEMIGGSVGGWTKQFCRSSYKRKWKIDLFSLEDRQTLIYRYLVGVTMTELCAQTGVHVAMFKKLLRTFGISKVRSLSEAKLFSRNYVIDERAFSRRTAECNYWVGFMITDGTVSRAGGGSPVIRVELQPGDRAHLDKFRSFLRTNKELETSKLGYVSFRFVSENAATDLATCGVYPRKTLVAETPDYLRDDIDFWRGVIDGDGWVTWPAGPVRPTIGVCGSEGIVKGFLEFSKKFTGPNQINACKHGNVWNVLIDGRGAIRLMYELYATDEVYLDRKQKKALGFVSRYVKTRDDFEVLEQTLPVTRHKPRPCSGCGVIFAPTRANGKYCSDECRHVCTRRLERARRKRQAKTKTKVLNYA